VRFPATYLELTDAGFQFLKRRMCEWCGEEISSFRSKDGKFLSLVSLAGGSYISHFSACQGARGKKKRHRAPIGQWRLF